MPIVNISATCFSISFSFENEIEKDIHLLDLFLL